ncbi:hypothetical protein EPR50_G00066380 [Perca flavescens]|uniref:Ig-like domain-containing protein n=1 Tax=Perca flavescens TaxID=8167 RepID=A0A484D9Q7_PERFV|nr:hypothetical protein EPR50_G00066380 [Perca flavescens]
MTGSTTVGTAREASLYMAIFIPVAALLIIIVVVAIIFCIKKRRSQSFTREESGYYENVSRASSNQAKREESCIKQDNNTLSEVKAIDEPVYINIEAIPSQMDQRVFKQTLKGFRVMELKLWFSFLLLNVIHDVQSQSASQWIANMPTNIPVLQGSCVVIPCIYTYPKPVSKRILTRIEMPQYKSFSYPNTVTIDVQSNPEPPTMSVRVYEKITASCSVSHSCPTILPRFSWSHPGSVSSRSKKLNTWQWETESTLTFVPQTTDSNMPLSCTVLYRGGKRATSSMIIST